MGSWVKIVNGVVVKGIRAEPEFFNTFVDDSPGEWLQTSYNTRGGIYYDANTNTPSQDQSKAFRKNFAGVGFIYDKDRDAFIPPKPYESWTLNDFSCLWEPPVPYPNDNKSYDWDEQNLQWVERL